MIKLLLFQFLSVFSLLKIGLYVRLTECVPFYFHATVGKETLRYRMTLQCGIEVSIAACGRMSQHFGACFYYSK